MTEISAALMPGPAFWASLLMLGAIGVPMMAAGRRLTRDPAPWVSGFIGRPLVTLGTVITTISAGRLVSWVYVWLRLLVWLAWPWR